MPEAVIIDCLRTPVGKAPRGALRNTRPDDLAAVVIRALLERYPQATEEIEDVILGCAMPGRRSGQQHGAWGAAARRPAGFRFGDDRQSLLQLRSAGHCAGGGAHSRGLRPCDCRRRQRIHEHDCRAAD